MNIVANLIEHGYCCVADEEANTYRLEWAPILDGRADAPMQAVINGWALFSHVKAVLDLHQLPEKVWRRMGFTNPRRSYWMLKEMNRTCDTAWAVKTGALVKGSKGDSFEHKRN